MRWNLGCETCSRQVEVGRVSRSRPGLAPLATVAWPTSLCSRNRFLFGGCADDDWIQAAECGRGPRPRAIVDESDPRGRVDPREQSRTLPGPGGAGGRARG